MVGGIAPGVEVGVGSVFVQGLADSVSGFEVTVRIKSTPSYACACSGADATTVTPAWQFEPGGCQGPGRLAVEFATVHAGCVAPIGQPSFTDFSTARDSAFCAPASCGTSNDLLTLRASRPQGWHFDPEVPTGLWSVNFDLSASCALGNGAGPCCTDDRPMALIVGGRAYALDGSPIDLGGGYVTYTASAVQTRPSSWGKLKAQYR